MPLAKPLSRFAAIYLRVSTADQAADDKSSLNRQLESCQALARGADVTVMPEMIFRDIMSGAREDRPGFIALKAAAKSRSFDTVYVWALDRLSRGDLRSAINSWAELADSGVSIVTVQEGELPSDPMYFSLLTGLAAKERQRIRERTLPAKLLKRDQGFWVLGRAPYGYRKMPDKTLEQHPQHAEVVRRIFREAKSFGRIAIARRLNAEGIPASWRGPKAKWLARSIDQILTNTMAYGTKHGVKFQIHPAPIILRSEFDDVAAIRAARYRVGKAPSEQWLLTGILRCECGGRYRHHQAKGRHYYVCSDRKAGSDCKGPNIRLEDAERQVISAVSTFLTQLNSAVVPQMLERLTRARVDTITSELAAKQSELDEIERQMKVLQETIVREIAAGATINDLPHFTAGNRQLGIERRRLSDETAEMSNELIRAQGTDHLTPEQTRGIIESLQEAAWIRVPDTANEKEIIYTDTLDPVLALRTFVQDAVVENSTPLGGSPSIRTTLHDTAKDPAILQGFLQTLILEEIRKLHEQAPIPLVDAGQPLYP